MDIDRPDLMTKEQREHFIKMWKECIPRVSFIDCKPPIIYGTGGELPSMDWENIFKHKE